MKRINVLICLLTVLCCSNDSYSQSIGQGNESSLVLNEEKSIDQQSLYNGNGNLTFNGSAIVDVPGEDQDYEITNINEIVRNDKLYQLISGYYSHVTVRKAFYGCVNGDDNKVLWLKSLGNNCGANHSQVSDVNTTEKNNLCKMYIAYLNKSYAWNDTLANSFGSIELRLDDIETPEIVSQEHYLSESLIHISMVTELLQNNSTATNDNFSAPNANSNEQSVHIWPNPSNQILNIDLEIIPDRLQLMDVKGRIVKELHPEDSQVNVSEINPGLYFLKLDYEDKSEVAFCKVLIHR